MRSSLRTSTGMAKRTPSQIVTINCAEERLGGQSGMTLLALPNITNPESVTSTAEKQVQPPASVHRYLCTSVNLIWRYVNVVVLPLFFHVKCQGQVVGLLNYHHHR